MSTEVPTRPATRARLAVERLSAGYGRDEVVCGLSLELSAGEVVALLGRNGSGKSTLLHAIAGVIADFGGRIHQGSVILAGSEVTGLSLDVLTRSGLALLPQRGGFFRSLSVRQNLELAARVAERPMPNASTDVLDEAPQDPSLERFGSSRQLAGDLSGGQQRLLALTMATSRPLSVLLLDEPMAGLSQANVVATAARLKALARSGVSILVAEQEVSVAAGIADRALYLESGSLKWASEGGDALLARVAAELRGASE